MEKEENLDYLVEACKDAKERGIKQVYVCLNSTGLWLPIESISVSDLTGFTIYVEGWDKNFITMKEGGL
jgi:hypothetical protein